MIGCILLTGFLSEGLRLLQAETTMYVVYFIHLTLILTLFLSAPYCKFAHFLYRTVAIAATWGFTAPTGASRSCRRLLEPSTGSLYKLKSRLNRTVIMRRIYE